MFESNILNPGQRLNTYYSGKEVIIKKLIGSGGQGEVYEVEVEGKNKALKWYYKSSATPQQRRIIENLIESSFDDNRFLLPEDIVVGENSFGYIMPLRPPDFVDLAPLIARKIEPDFSALCTAGFNLADAFRNLHLSGLCYQDIALRNIFIKEETGEILICDNDNITVIHSGEGEVLGTLEFIAPEVGKKESLPDAETDKYSLAVLLFYMFFLNHPLEGKKDAEIECFDEKARKKLYIEEPVFIFDPNDDSNRPTEEFHNNAIIYWEIYPEFIKELFIRAFTKGLHDRNERVQEGEWKKAFIKLRQLIVYCIECGSENFYDPSKKKVRCWKCNRKIILPPRLVIKRKWDDEVVMLNYDTKLYPHHIDRDREYDFSEVWGEVNQHPENPKIWGIKNLSPYVWQATMPDGSIKQIPQGKSIIIKEGITLTFENLKAKITTRR